MKIAICDDEVTIGKEVGSILKELGYKADVYTNPLQLLEKEYQLYFLDIGMEELDGIEVGKRIREKQSNCFIIYLTNFHDYHAQAFGVHAFDYLQKPVAKEDIARVMKDLSVYGQKEELKFQFKTKSGILQIKKQDILYFEFSSRKVLLHTTKTSYPIAQSLHVIAEKMEPYHFCMPHKSFCVNMANIQLVKGYDITMINGDILPLSQKKSQLFHKALNDYLFEKVSGVV